MVLTVALVCMSAVMIVLLLRPRPQPVVPHEPPGSIMDERLLEYDVRGGVVRGGPSCGRLVQGGPHSS
jgi:hypothetical protein